LVRAYQRARRKQQNKDHTTGRERDGLSKKKTSAHSIGSRPEVLFKKSPVLAEEALPLPRSAENTKRKGGEVYQGKKKKEPRNATETRPTLFFLFQTANPHNEPQRTTTACSSSREEGGPSQCWARAAKRLREGRDNENCGHLFCRKRGKLENLFGLEISHVFKESSLTGGQVYKVGKGQGKGGTSRIDSEYKIDMDDL